VLILRFIFNTEVEPHYVQYCWNLPNQTFLELCGVPKAYASSLTACWIKRQLSRRGAPHIFTGRSEVLLFLLHIRHYPTYIFLASLFETSKQRLQRLCDDLLDFFAVLLHNKVSLGTLKERQQDSFQMWGQYYTYIVDGTEQRCPSSGNPLEDFDFYSTKKKQHSINTLIVASPKGKILYISPSFGGSHNDSDILKRTQKNWLELFDSTQERGIGDSGFDGLTELGLDSPVADHTAPIYKVFSSKRIRIEMVNANLKDWQSLFQKIRTNLDDRELLLVMQNARWRIVAAFLNDRLSGWKL
jgi:hypothetical protein